MSCTWCGASTPGPLVSLELISDIFQQQFLIWWYLVSNCKWKELKSISDFSLQESWLVISNLWFRKRWVEKVLRITIFHFSTEPIIYLWSTYMYVWFTLLDWIQFAIDDLISGHICFHSYHCCVHVWKVTSIQFRFRDILCWTYWCVVNVGWWMFQGKELASKANFSPMQCRFGFCRVEKIVLAACVKIQNLNKGFFLKLLEVKGGFGRQTRLG